MDLGGNRVKELREFSDTVSPLGIEIEKSYEENKKAFTEDFTVDQILKEFYSTSKNQEVGNRRDVKKKKRDKMVKKSRKKNRR